jgi:hypothetical protein
MRRQVISPILEILGKAIGLCTLLRCYIIFLLCGETRTRKFDVVLVWKLDRLGRSLKDLINTLDELGHLEIDFVSYDNKIDTSTPMSTAPVDQSLILDCSGRISLWSGFR